MKKRAAFSLPLCKRGKESAEVDALWWATSWAEA